MSDAPKATPVAYDFGPYAVQVPSGQQFPARANAEAAPGNGSLPPGANVFRVNKRKGANTPASFIKKVEG